MLELDWAVTHSGASSIFGPATGRSAVLSSTMVGLVEAERIHRAWRFVDYASAGAALGVDLDERALALARKTSRRGGIPWEFGEVRAGLAQTAPTALAPPPPGLAQECAPPCLQLQAAWNARRFDRLTSLYAADATVLSGADTIGPGSPLHPWALILSACPHAVLFFERAVTRLEEGDARVALVWRWVGVHSGETYGPPCGRRLHARGASVLRVRDGRIASERIVFDALGFRRDAALRSMA